MKIVITVEGGLVQYVEAPPGVVVEVLDFDIDGQEDICHCNLAVDGEAHLHSTFGSE